METLTLENRIQILGETKSLPVGQRCRKLQYPVVTEEQLAERFAVHKLAKAYNAKEVQRIYVDLAVQYGITMELAIHRFRIDLKGGELHDTVEVARRDAMRGSMGMTALEQFNMLGGLSGMRRPGSSAYEMKAKFCTGYVRMVELDSYMGDEIPERVIDSLEVAKEAGLKEFLVAYPAIETRDVTVTEKQEKDPVLLARLGRVYLEIDMWE